MDDLRRNLVKLLEAEADDSDPAQERELKRLINEARGGTLLKLEN